MSYEEELENNEIKIIHKEDLWLVELDKLERLINDED